MLEKDVVVSVQEIKPGKTDDVQNHFTFNSEERDSLRDELRDEGIYIESVFIHEAEDGNYLYSYIKAEDWQQMLDEWRKSDAEEAVAFKEFLDEAIVGGWEQFHEERIENVFHMEVPQQGEQH